MSIIDGSTPAPKVIAGDNLTIVIDPGASASASEVIQSPGQPVVIPSTAPPSIIGFPASYTATSNLFIQDTAPVSPPIPYLWIQTDFMVDDGVTIWYDDGEP